VSVDGIDVSITPASKALERGGTFIYKVTLVAGDTVDANKYEGTITAIISNLRDIKASKSFEVWVLPTEEKKRQIDDLYVNYSSMFEDDKTEFERLKSLGFLNEDDLNKIQNTFTALENTMSDVEESLDAGDYLTAYISLKQFKNFHEQFVTELNTLEAVQTDLMDQQWGGLWVWFVVGVVAVGAGGLLTYKFILVEGYTQKLGYKPKRNLLTQIKSNLNSGKDKLSGVGNKVNMNVNSIKKPFKDESVGQKVMKYSNGYQKRYPYQYSYSGISSSLSNGVTKVKDFFKRKKSSKYLSDYYS
jgi:hypothetical protein